MTDTFNTCALIVILFAVPLTLYIILRVVIYHIFRMTFRVVKFMWARVPERAPGTHRVGFWNRVGTYLVGHFIFSMLTGVISIWGLMKYSTYVMAAMCSLAGWHMTPPEEVQQEKTTLIARAKERFKEETEEIKERAKEESIKIRLAAEAEAAEIKEKAKQKAAAIKQEADPAYMAGRWVRSLFPW